jgi:two-component system CheB/CheR fusion protein
VTVLDEMQTRELEELLEYLARTRNFDFAGYKRQSLARRISSRMAAVRVGSFAEYIDFLEVHSEEFPQLFNAILINVTSFFRDPPVWEYVASDVIPRLLADKAAGDPIRVWSAGCASGEEAATLAILLNEALGPEGFRERVKIYATDVDEVELAQARSAEYSARQVQTVPEVYRQKYFEQSGPNYCLNRDLRRALIFGRHDLLQDAPISRIDLLACRNTLMYFNAEAQASILARFNFALRERGFLLMGKAEMLLTHQSLFTPVDMRRRVFRKVPRPALRDRMLALSASEREMVPVAGRAEFADAAFEASPLAQVVVDASGVLMLANEKARTLFSLEARDLGRPLQDLDFSYRPVELRPHLERALLERRIVNLRDVEWRGQNDEAVILDVQLAPLSDIGGGVGGASIAFVDVGRYRKLHDELQTTRRELETAYEELQTTNEEFQSAVEELETTNEELQSTNEELETVNEELQSTNEELQAMNQEMQLRSDELNSVNAFLESVFASMRDAVVVTDRDLRVQVWNPTAEELWGLRAGEVVGQHFLNLDIGLPITQLSPAIRGALNGQRERVQQTLTAVNRRGRSIQCRVDTSPLAGPGAEVRGVILLMEAVSEFA